MDRMAAPQGGRCRSLTELRWRQRARLELSSSGWEPKIRESDDVQPAGGYELSSPTSTCTMIKARARGVCPELRKADTSPPCSHPGSSATHSPRPGNETLGWRAQRCRRQPGWLVSKLADSSWSDFTGHHGGRDQGGRDHHKQCPALGNRSEDCREGHGTGDVNGVELVSAGACQWILLDC